MFEFYWLEIPAIVKAIAFFVVWGSCWIPLALLTWNALNWLSPDYKIASKLPLLASLYAIAPLMVWGVSQLEGVSISDYGFSPKFSLLISLGWGWGLGVFGLGILFALQLGLGWLKFNQQILESLAPKIGLSVLLPTFLLSLWISATEELIFRGFLLNQLQQDYSLWVAAIASSLIFALLHLIWEVQETTPQLPGLWLMGMVLVLARWVDGGSLGLAWGLHAGWVWGIASLDTINLITYTDQVPAWITGLGKKPLAGIMGMGFLLTTAGILMGLRLIFKT